MADSRTELLRKQLLLKQKQLAVPVEVVSEPSQTADLERQLGLTARAGAQGVAGLVGLAYDPLAAIQNLLVGPEGLVPLTSENIPPLRSQVRDILTSAGVPEAETATERVVQVASEAMTGGGLQTKLATALTPFLTGTSQQVATQLAAQPVAQQIAAGTAGGAAQVTGELGGGPLAQLGAGLLGGLVGGRAAGVRFEPTPAAVPEAIREAEQAGVRVMTTDVRGPETFAGRWLQRAGEMVPLAGTGGPRAAQQEERIQAVRNVLRDFGAEDAAQASDDVMASLLRNRSKQITKYTTMKSGVINDLRDAGVVDVTNTVKSIDDEIARLSGLGTEQVTPVISILQDWKNALRGMRVVERPDGTTATEYRGQGIVNVEELRKQIGQAFTSPDLASVRGIGEKSLSKIYAPLRDDMENFVRENGKRNDIVKFKVANKQLSSLAGELENSALKTVLKKGDMTPETVRNMLFSQKPSDVKTLYKNLDAEGRRNARAAILHEALKKAGGNIDEISPDRFKQALVKLGTQTGVFFGGDDLKAVEGLVRTLKMTERAGQAAVSPPTGLQAAPAVGAAFLTDLFGGFGSGLVAGAGIGGLARLYESAPVRNLLLKIPQTKIGSTEEAELIKRLADAMRAEKAAKAEE